MKVVATDDERFADLVDYPFAPNRYTWDGLNLHYLDEGSGPPPWCCSTASRPGRFSTAG